MRIAFRPIGVVGPLFAVALGGIAVFGAACSSSSAGGTSNAPLTCASPGKPTPGPADDHCNGTPAQVVTGASCSVDDAGLSGGGASNDAGDSDAGPAVDSCPYGKTMFGSEADDDDCKYHLKWSTTQICEGSPGVTFSVTVTDKAAGKPVTGVPQGLITEAFVPTDPNAACDTASTHPSPSPANLIESPAGSGTYVGKIVFDAPGDWTVRFHIHEECLDVLDDSPHGHAAFRVSAP